MKSMYSLVVRTTRVHRFPEYLVIIDKGVSAFNAILEDPEIFREILKSDGVEIIRMVDLNENAQASDSPMLPPKE